MWKKIKVVVYLLIIGSFFNIEIGEAVEVNGNQSGIWSLSNSPYVVTGTVTVLSGETLVIEPKVEVRFATNTSLVVCGTLSAIGTLDGTITFTSNAGTPTPGNWNSIKFSGVQSKGTISYSLIEYGKQAIYLENVSKITVTHNTIRNNKGDDGSICADGEIGAGICLFSSTNNTLAGNIISNNQGGQGGPADYGISGGEGGIGAGIYLLSSTNTTIIDNIISNNNGGEGGQGADRAAGGHGGSGVGIYLESSTNNTITDNTISNNNGGQGGREGFLFSSAGGGGIGAGIYLSSNTNIITGNTISNNSGGGGGSGNGLGAGGAGGIGVGIYLISSTNVTISTNTISYNQGGQGGPGGDHGAGGAGGIGVGIYWQQSTNNTITNNTISDNRGGQGGGSGSENLGGGGGKGVGMYLSSSTNNTITGNTVSNNRGGDGGSGGFKSPGGTGGTGGGIHLFSSTHNTITSNTISNNSGGKGGGPNGSHGNGYGIYIDSNSYNNIIDSNNTYNGEPIHYYYGITLPTTVENRTLTLTGSGSTNLGRIVLINCSNFTIRNNYITGGIGENGQTGGGYDYPGGTGSIGAGIYLSSSTNNTITGNTISGNRGGQGGAAGPHGSGGLGGIGVGIYLLLSTNNTIKGNTIYNNSGGEGGAGYEIGSRGRGGSGVGIYLDSSSSNTIAQNNTITNNIGGAGNPDGNGVGIYCKSSQISPLIYNHIYNNQTYNLQTDISPGPQIAEYNWWGSDPPEISKFSGNIDYDPWLRGTYTTQIMISPVAGTVGTIVTVSGQGFGENELISIEFGTTGTITTGSTNILGTFTTIFTVNTQPYGTTTVRAVGVDSNRSSEMVFCILPKIFMVSPTIGTVGTFITVRGNGFGATESICIDFGTTKTIIVTFSTHSGNFTTIFTVNSQPLGTTTIIGKGMLSECFAIEIFYILPPTILKITPAIQNIAVNSTFTCQVEIEDVSNLVAGDLYISYDSNILEVTGVGSGTFPPNCNAVSKITAGKIDYSFGLFSGSATGSGILCFLHFKAIAGGTSSVAIDTTQDRKTILLKIDIDTPEEIPFTKEDAIYYVISKIKIKPQDKIIKADEDVEYQCIGECGSGLELDVTGSTTFSSNGGGSFTLNTFHAKYMSTYTIQGEYLGFIGTTSVIILPGTPTTLVYVSGNGQVNTCTFTLKDPFIVKVVDKYENPCQDVEVKWEIISIPSGATLYSISPTNTTTNAQGTVSSFLTLGTEPPGTYTIHAISTGLSGSPCIFTAHSLRRFGNIAGFCLLKLGTISLGTCSDIRVRIVELGTTTMTNDSSYFIFENIPVGTYTLNFDTWGASPSTKTNICISPTQFEDTTYIGTITLLAGDVNNDGQVNIGDWPLFADAWREKATKTHTNWELYKEADFNHDSKVDAYDFIVIRNNFGEQQKGKAKELIAMSTKAKKTSGKIELSFDLETLEGVDINELRVGNIIYLKIYVRDAKDYLGGEIHLAFNPKVLQVIDADNSKDGIQIQPGDFPQGSLNYTPVELKNEVDNLVGKIDYAVAVWEPEQGEKGILAIVPFKVISCGAYSKVNFEFDDEENRETKFIERIGQEQPVDQQPEVLDEEIIIKVPAVFNNLEGALVYPNPAYKGQEVTFDQLTTDKQITLRIYSLAGELVFEKSGMNEIKWNLKNKDNEDVASGIYIYFLKDELGSV
ncbi:MAG: right-handed parallel beta-helix repeat-containing protein, partial [bacterium]